MVAFDLPDKAQRDQFHAGLFEIGLLALKCGERSIRFRPALDVPAEAVRQALDIVREQCGRMRTESRTGILPVEAEKTDVARTGALPGQARCLPNVGCTEEPFLVVNST